ncbi:MAG TPA: methylated-DNA--protein-cysteine methyltransferase, partial [Caulobacteraceae bacterium]
MRLQLDRIASPIGVIRLVHDDEGRLRSLDFEDFEARNLKLLARHYGRADLTAGRAPNAVKAALDGYFAGDLAALG